MLLPVIEEAIGEPNGYLSVFYTKKPYRPGTLVVFLNATSLVAAGDNGWIETGNNSFKLKEVPLPGDVIMVYYIPAF